MGVHNHRARTYNIGDDPDFRQALFADWSRPWHPEEVLIDHNHLDRIQDNIFLKLADWPWARIPMRKILPAA